MIVRFIDYPKGVLAEMLGNGGKLFIKLFGITIHKYYICTELKIYIVMIVNIYGLVHPSTKEVIYVGQTRTSIENRLDEHYWKLNEAKRGKRTMTKLFKFLDSYLPLKVQVKLLKVVDTDKPFSNADFMERYYIEYYRKINPNLLNEANGGIGGYTSINKSDDEKSEISKKISKANKGRKKPDGFAKNLSTKRKGANNPMAKKIDVGIYNDKNELIHTCHYGFEVDEFLGNKWFWSNNGRAIKNGFAVFRFGYKIKRIV